MAKNNRGRIRVFFAEFEGDSETIQEGLQAIGVAVNKTFQRTVMPLRSSVGTVLGGDCWLGEFKYFKGIDRAAFRGSRQGEISRSAN